MGCSSSKVARKRAASEDCYAPLSRSVSAPIHHPAESEGESCHVVSLTSSSYGILRMDRHGYLAEGGSFLKLAMRKQVFKDELDEFESSLSDSDVKKVVSRTKLKPVKEDDERQLLEDNGDLEVINTWELMEGLEDGSARSLPPLTALGTKKRRCPERAKSFGAVQGLDYGNAEISSPVWRKYFSQDSEKEKRLHRHGESPITPPPMSPFKTRLQSSRPIMVADTISVSPMEPLDGNSNLKLLTSPAETSSSIGSSLRKDVSAHETSLSSGADTEYPFEDFSREAKSSDSLSSPGRRINGKSGLKESSSPLFDPALVATFEQALEAITVAEDEWLLVHADGSTTHSSSGNSTWGSSETSSDAESLQEQKLNNSEENPVQGLRQKKISPSKVMPVNDKEEQQLDSFELRCPPRGEEKAVLYFTSLRGIRKTYEDCCDLRLILQGLGVKVDERDVWMHSKFKEELTQVLGDKKLAVPRLFIRGRYIGGAEEVRQLHEDGILARLIQGLPMELGRKVCDGCGDLRFIPCITCSGSCKVLDEDDQVARCLQCNENGLIMCPICN